MIFAAIQLNELEDKREFLARTYILAGSFMSLVFLISYFFVSAANAKTMFMGNPNPLSYWIGTTIFVNLIFRKSFSQEKLES